jgi:hypothetical protein
MSIRKVSPFVYGNTVSKKAFTNRVLEIDRLYNNLINGINTMIISPRRWGKSSLVEKVANQIHRKHKDIKVVIIDLYSISSEEQFLEVFAREIIKASTSRWQEWVNTAKNLFKKLIPKITFSLDPVDFSLGFDWDEMKRHSDEILNMPEIISKQKKMKMVVCIDEFQNITQFPGGEILEKKLRANWQRHKNVSYCLYGSKRHMMSDIFNNSSKPFYRFGDIMLLPKISRKDWVKFIIAKFKSTGKKIETSQAQIIADKMQNHSWYVQQYAHYTWLRTQKEVTQEILDVAFNEMIRSNLPFYQQILESLSSTQVNLLKAVARGEEHLTASKTMRDYHLGTPNNVRKNRIILIKKDLIELFDEVYHFMDPIFLFWFNREVLKA